MIVILYEPASEKISLEIQADILTTFKNNVGVTRISTSDKLEWPGEVSWDDLLLVLYDGPDFPAEGNIFIESYIKVRKERFLLLPVAIRLMDRKPPEAASAIKALPYDVTAQGATGLLVNRVGCMLGLRLQGRDSRIFISHRQVDGAKIAKQLHSHFASLGHHPWMDEAREMDGDTSILPGSKVQDEIDLALNDASLVLLIDTPSAPTSPWIRHEVETADAMLLPILPICFRDATDKRKGPRFRSLAGLQRWFSVENPLADTENPLSEDLLEKIALEAEKYLCEIFQRKCRVPFIVEREFLNQGFDWKIRDRPLFMFESSKTGGRMKTKVISHCSIFEQIYLPSITKFRNFINTTDRANYSLFIYDGELMSPIELNDFVENPDEQVVVLHHQELSALISSNFSNLGSK